MCDALHNHSQPHPQLVVKLYQLFLHPHILASVIELKSWRNTILAHKTLKVSLCQKDTLSCSTERDWGICSGSIYRNLKLIFWQRFLLYVATTPSSFLLPIVPHSHSYSAENWKHWINISRKYLRGTGLLSLAASLYENRQLKGNQGVNFLQDSFLQVWLLQVWRQRRNLMGALCKSSQRLHLLVTL